PQHTRKRKVKCDEGKPYCNHCLRTGRRCEGYSSVPQAPSLPITRDPDLHTRLFASSEERRSFFFFQNNASKSLGGIFNTSFWGREVMQAAIHYPLVRHLVIALGSAYETFESGTVIQDGSLALQQRACAINLLHNLMQRPDIASEGTTGCILTAVVLFIYLACVRGRYAEAFQHIRSGVTLLQQLEDSIQERKSVLRVGYPISSSRLRYMLSSTYGQFRGMVNDTFLETGSYDVLRTEVKPAVLFTSLGDAHSYIENLRNNALSFLQSCEFRPNILTDELESTVGRHRQLCLALESSQNALDSYVRGLSAHEHDTMQDGISILRVHQLLLVIRLHINVLKPEERESSYIIWEGHFEEILRQCESAVQREQDRIDAGTFNSCSSGLGYVMPLHAVAARCRDPQLRHRAAELLLKAPMRDGLWDSRVIGRIVSKTIQLEEGSSGTMGSKVREVKLEALDDEKVTLQFITVDDWREGRRGQEMVVQL
ncbi:transcriptional regulatory protein moc3, partial [Dichotomopilus funicola]